MSVTVSKTNRLSSILLSDEALPVNILEDKVNLSELCRTCLCNTTTNDMGNNTLSIVTANGKLLPIYQVFEIATGCEFEFNSKLPHHLCSSCLKLLTNSYTIRTQSQRAGDIIRFILATTKVEVDDTTETYQAIESTSIEENLSVAASKELEVESQVIVIDDEASDPNKFENQVITIEDEASDPIEQEREHTPDAISVLGDSEEEVFMILDESESDENVSDCVEEFPEQSKSKVQAPNTCQLCQTSFVELRDFILHFHSCAGNVKRNSIQSDKMPINSRCTTKKCELWCQNQIEKCHKSRDQPRTYFRPERPMDWSAADEVKSKSPIQEHTQLRKKYVCLFCDQTSDQFTKLKEHMLSHTLAARKKQHKNEMCERVESAHDIKQHHSEADNLKGPKRRRNKKTPT